nr:aldehyde dehydrogenase family protein [Oleomonas cavernae]
MSAQILNFIDGAYRKGNAWFEKRNPCDNKVFAEVAEAGEAEVDAAVAAARRALKGPWGKLTVNERAAILHKVADGITRRFDEFLEAECRDTGKPKSLARHIDIPRGRRISRSSPTWSRTCRRKASSSTRPMVPARSTMPCAGPRA